jgi:hypothetical protein
MTDAGQHAADHRRDETRPGERGGPHRDRVRAGPDGVSAGGQHGHRSGEDRCREEACKRLLGEQDGDPGAVGGTRTRVKGQQRTSPARSRMNAGPGGRT